MKNQVLKSLIFFLSFVLNSNSFLYSHAISSGNLGIDISERIRIIVSLSDHDLEKFNLDKNTKISEDEIQHYQKEMVAWVRENLNINYPGVGRLTTVVDEQVFSLADSLIYQRQEIFNQPTIPSFDWVEVSMNFGKWNGVIKYKDGRIPFKISANQKFRVGFTFWNIILAKIINFINF